MAVSFPEKCNETKKELLDCDLSLRVACSGLSLHTNPERELVILEVHGTHIQNPL